MYRLNVITEVSLDYDFGTGYVKTYDDFAESESFSLDYVSDNDIISEIDIDYNDIADSLRDLTDSYASYLQSRDINFTSYENLSNSEQLNVVFVFDEKPSEYELHKLKQESEGFFFDNEHFAGEFQGTVYDVPGHQLDVDRWEYDDIECDVFYNFLFDTELEFIEVDELNSIIKDITDEL